jgi:REP element-mobilizing transposase RayT
MRSRYRVKDKEQAHFVTSTTVAWLPICTAARRCDVVVDSLEYCRARKELTIYGWVILDNHFHAVLSAPDLPRVMADLKRHTARRVIELLEEETPIGCCTNCGIIAPRTRVRVSIRSGRRVIIRRRSRAMRSCCRSWSICTTIR